MYRSNSKQWQVVLTPHRSLTRTGFLVLMGVVVAANLAIGGLFVVLGAWPVAGFACFDVLLVWLAFRWNFSSAGVVERISVTEHELILDRLNHYSPPERWRFVRRWVRVELQENRERELVGSLCLVSGQARIVIGDFLSAEERKSLAAALDEALAIPRI
jgi:uncharacterized membrane protein